MRKLLKSAILGAVMLLESFLNGCITNVLPPAPDKPPPIETRALVGLSLPGYGLCTAVAIEPQTLATAAHCTTGGISWFIEDVEGTKQTVERYWRSNSEDVALLHVAARVKWYSTLSSELPQVLEHGWIAGYGCDHFRRLDVRGVWYIGRESHGALVYDGSACHGDSGGGIFDEGGRMVAITDFVEESVPVGKVGATPVAALADGLMSDWHTWREAPSPQWTPQDPDAGP